MGKVGTGFSTSLDGFIAGSQGEVGSLFDWYFDGQTEYRVPSGGITLEASPQSAELLRKSYGAMGALVVGRRHFDHAGGWGGRQPMDLPAFVVTRRVPEEWGYEGSSFTFVKDGVESAIEQAKATAGDKNVGVGGANAAQQCIKAGLVDEIGIDLVPILLGDGIRFFDHLGAGSIELERTSVV